MTNEIYCYGGIDIYRDVFNAIAMLNGDKGFIQSLITIGVIVGAFWASIMMIFGDLVKPFTNLANLVKFQGKKTQCSMSCLHGRLYDICGCSSQNCQLKAGLSVFLEYIF